jgi:adenosylcobinamide kinase/adenosylcobinamide-phosphate guanylyltransferase
LTLILGGARSGKSRHAEGLARAAGRPRRYIATAQAFDAEMDTRIARHKADRGDGWTLVEAPLALAAALAAVPATEVVLVDCATLWLTNHLLAGHDLAAETAGLLAALTACAAPVIVVSNEVGWSITPDNALSRAFTDAQGRLNQALADQADRAILVVAGLPMTLK